MKMQSKIAFFLGFNYFDTLYGSKLNPIVGSGVRPLCLPTYAFVEPQAQFLSPVKKLARLL